MHVFTYVYNLYTIVWDIYFKTYFSSHSYWKMHCSILIYKYTYIWLIYMCNLHSKYVHWMYEHRIYVLNNIQIFFITPRLTPATNQILLNKLFKLYARLVGYRHQKGFYKNCQDWKYFTWKKEKGLFLGNTLYS